MILYLKLVHNGSQCISWNGRISKFLEEHASLPFPPDSSPAPHPKTSSYTSDLYCIMQLVNLLFTITHENPGPTIRKPNP